MKIESYIGTPLSDSTGRILGLMALMDSRPLKNPALAESMLSIFAVRASAELERKQAEDKLRKFSHAVEQNPALIVITDPDGSIEYVNPRFTEKTGYSLEEVIGKNPVSYSLAKPLSKLIRTCGIPLPPAGYGRASFLTKEGMASYSGSTPLYLQLKMQVEISPII